MKKFLILFFLCILCLCGCNSRENVHNISLYSADKEQQISIKSADSVFSDNISDSGEIKKFVNNLRIEDWELSQLPENAQESGNFTFLQEKTEKILQAEADERLYEFFSFSCYKDLPYISVKIADSEMNFKISEDTAGYLNDFLTDK
ncbi:MULTISPECIES: hypothetical protein [Lentihominibacter]|jgi:hypothetical protein|uniref:Uncharacterized protein n=1 Tax=Lentihominibacter hominis TaxID=2763645 RepID=A0A926E683_9FIRM|nr:hypothetical protein [Lentihominibacter hominis]MBC8568610.1 hypothetical protein [Lentihominibacter hominis]